MRQAVRARMPALVLVPVLLILPFTPARGGDSPSSFGAATDSLAPPPLPPALDIPALERELETTENRDSIRFLLAVAWREAGGVEGRQRSLDLFERIRRRYYDDPRYHVELARTYLEAGRRSDARDAFDRATRLRPQEPEAYLTAIRLLREQVLRYGHPDDVAEVLVRTARAAAIHPGHVMVREERALCLQLAYLFLEGGVGRAVAALQAADSLLALAPESEPGLVLRATALLELGRGREAEGLFARWEGQVAETSGRSVPGPPVSAGGDSLRAEAAWNRLDPTPLTLVNEARLEHRRRLALADLLYRDLERGRRGWETPRGELFVRFGPPHAVDFRRAFWQGGGAQYMSDWSLVRWRERENVSLILPFLHPVQRWKYRYGDRELVFDFVDAGFSGQFVPVDGIGFEEQLREVPAVLPGTLEGRAPSFFFAGAGTRGEDGRTREVLAVAIPVSGNEEAFRGEASRSLRVLDAGGREVIFERAGSSPDSIREPTPGLRFLTSRSEVRLAPGLYTGEVLVDSRRASATVTFPFTVPAFGQERLQISDLEFSFVGGGSEEPAREPIPNPGGLVISGARTLVRYEVYNFTPDGRGTVRYRTRYALVPQEYARAVARLVEEGDPSVDPDRYLGGLGESLGGVTLHPGNYVDVSFPEVSTPLEAGARGRFNFELDAARVDPGAYALEILVSDETAGRAVVAQAPVRVLAAEEVGTLGAVE